LCRSCYERSRYSQRLFGGLRFEALVRDRFRCRVCSSPRYPVVHRRQPDQHQLETFITLCASCLGVVMYLDRPASWLPPLLLALWQEQHPGTIVQQQFEFGGWQTPSPTEQAFAAPPSPPTPLDGPPCQGVLFP
jgi:5-methylcytosine-specific restriction endonuclease McrA